MGSKFDQRSYRPMIGDRVMFIRDDESVPYGSVGTVVTDDGGVDFDDFHDGHDCRGRARGGHGWYSLGGIIPYYDDGQDEMVPPTDDEIFSLFK
jgi:hypothetical protein